MTVEAICKEIKERLERVHIGRFRGMDKPLLLISNEYPGVWLEHVYDSVIYAQMDRTKLYLAENTINLFIDYQTKEGQLPCYVWNGDMRDLPPEELIGYSQIQECVSFPKLAFMVYKMNRDASFLERIYTSGVKWANWLAKNRMTTGRGLIEMFVGYDTGHDNSSRLTGLSCRGNYSVDGVLQNAAVLPPNDEVAPILAVDMNSNYYATLTALAAMADELKLSGEADEWRSRANDVKAKMLELLYNEEDAFFYDVDKNGRQRKYKSSTIFHPFLEGVLDPVADAAIIKEIYDRHISNPEEFATPYPYPSMAINDPSCEGHDTFNCWGYYTQGLIALRTTMWMEKYDFTKAYEYLCRTWIEVWTRHWDKLKLGQELDPITGEPTDCSEWYSANMLFYLHAAKYVLGIS